MRTPKKVPKWSSDYLLILALGRFLELFFFYSLLGCLLPGMEGKKQRDAEKKLLWWLMKKRHLGRFINKNAPVRWRRRRTKSGFYLSVWDFRGINWASHWRPGKRSLCMCENFTRNLILRGARSGVLSSTKQNGQFFSDHLALYKFLWPEGITILLLLLFHLTLVDGFYCSKSKDRAI